MTKRVARRRRGWGLGSFVVLSCVLAMAGSAWACTIVVGQTTVSPAAGAPGDPVTVGATGVPGTIWWHIRYVAPLVVNDTCANGGGLPVDGGADVQSTGSPDSLDGVIPDTEVLVPGPSGPGLGQFCWWDGGPHNTPPAYFVVT